MNFTNFLGIPVKGDITHGDVRPEQYSLSQLEPLLRALLEDDTIVEFGWRQYTPYFNDGDPCVFSADEIWVRTVTDTEESENGDSEDLSVEYHHPSLGEIEWEYFGEQYPRERRVKDYKGPDLDRFLRCDTLNRAIQGGHFDNVLLEAFGDHAEITVRRTGITVKFYSHD